MPAPAPEGRLPVLPGLALLGVAALGLAMLAPLGTAGLPAAGRLLFWAALLFAATWQGLQWFRRVPPLLPASRAALPVLFVGGSALTMVLLPLEYGLLARASGLDPVLPWRLLLLALAAIAIVIAVVITAVRWLALRLDPPATRPDQAV